jgi:hypothetical protein
MFANSAAVGEEAKLDGDHGRKWVFAELALYPATTTMDPAITPALVDEVIKANQEQKIDLLLYIEKLQKELDSVDALIVHNFDELSNKKCTDIDMV